MLKNVNKIVQKIVGQKHFGVWPCGPNFLKKIYIYLIIPFNYFIEKINYPRIVNLDEYAKYNKEIFKKKLNFLFEYFNSDKGNKFINQYARFSKKNNKLIKGHKYAGYYEMFFKKIKKKI